MKLVLVCTAVVLLMSAVELVRLPRRRMNSIEQIYNAFNITPVPDEKCYLIYGDYEVTLGMEVSPEAVQGVPDIGFKFDPGCYYTVILWTPDWPSSNYSFLSPSLMGLSVNYYYSSDGFLDSCEIATWLSPSPPPGTGVHRYIVEVLKQSEMIDISDPDLCRYQTERHNFLYLDFVKTYDLTSPPAGGCVFSSQYPMSED